MVTIKARPNPNKRNPTLAHLRRVVIDSLDVPERPLSRYEEELARFHREHYAVQLSSGTVWFNTDTGQQVNKAGD